MKISDFPLYLKKNSKKPQVLTTFAAVIPLIFLNMKNGALAKHGQSEGEGSKFASQKWMLQLSIKGKTSQMCLKAHQTAFESLKFFIFDCAGGVPLTGFSLAVAGQAAVAAVWSPGYGGFSWGAWALGLPAFSSCSASGLVARRHRGIFPS